MIEIECELTNKQQIVQPTHLISTIYSSRYQPLSLPSSPPSWLLRLPASADFPIFTFCYCCSCSMFSTKQRQQCGRRILFYFIFHFISFCFCYCHSHIFEIFIVFFLRSASSLLTFVPYRRAVDKKSGTLDWKQWSSVSGEAIELIIQIQKSWDIIVRKGALLHNFSFAASALWVVRLEKVNLRGWGSGWSGKALCISGQVNWYKVTEKSKVSHLRDLFCCYPFVPTEIARNENCAVPARELLKVRVRCQLWWTLSTNTLLF